jgi:hypothetical protein
MNLYIAMRNEEEVLAIVLADSYDKANIAFVAMGHSPNSIEEISNDTSLGISGVVFVANTHIRENRYGETSTYIKRGI